jgi:hypothetical protein
LTIVRPLPVCPQLQTSRRSTLTVAMGQIRTHASQQTVGLFDRLVGSVAGDGAAHRAYRRAESVLIKRGIPAIELP